MGDGKLSAKFDPPVPAALRVVPELGEPWDATDEDLRRFGYVDRSAAYQRFNSWLRSVLEIDDATESALNIIRHAVECAIMDYGHMPGSIGDDPEEDAQDLRHIRVIERAAAKALQARKETP